MSVSWVGVPFIDKDPGDISKTYIEHEPSPVNLNTKKVGNLNTITYMELM